MIGQKKLLQWVDNSRDDFARFVVLIAPKGCGKRMMANYIAKSIGAIYTEVGIKVDEVREVINTSYTVTDKTVYCFADADNMRQEAKNAMLKVTEEPPNNAYFILTVQDDSSLLSTIKSRAYVLQFEPYSKTELEEYCSLKGHSTNLANVATNPYQVDELAKYGNEFAEYVELVMDNIAEVKSANAFKSGTKLALKNDSGYDLHLFFNMFILKCLQRIEDDIEKYSAGILVTSRYANDVNKLGSNKQHLFDMWVLDIRRLWY